MKCPRCNGDGSVPYHIADDMFDEDVCPMCNGTGEVEQTNEEWFCQLSTEEKAKWIATQCGNAVMESTYDVSKLRKKMSVMHPVKRGAVDMDMFIENVAEWLKQPHNSPK